MPIIQCDPERLIADRLAMADTLAASVRLGTLQVAALGELVGVGRPPERNSMRLCRFGHHSWCALAGLGRRPW
ncbi:MAG: hypothetical protein Q8P41_18500 [Pseudomonadota bacterium]|nr:hypothetical protein [Pseudomonadota bacterium]